MVFLEAELSPSISLDLPLIPSEVHPLRHCVTSLKEGLKIRIIRSHIQHILSGEKEYHMTSH